MEDGIQSIHPRGKVAGGYSQLRREFLCAFAQASPYPDFRRIFAWQKEYGYVFGGVPYSIGRAAFSSVAVQYEYEVLRLSEFLERSSVGGKLVRSRVSADTDETTNGYSSNTLIVYNSSNPTH